MSDRARIELRTEAGEAYALLGAVVLIIGTFMPWVRTIVTYSGVDTRPGVPIVFGGLLVGGLVLVRDWTARDQALAALVGLGAGWKYLDLRAASTTLEVGQETSFSLVSPGIGIFVTMGGGLLVVAAAVVGYRSETSSHEATVP